jgi:hypothetical protein
MRRRYYLAYGSNLNIRQMRMRCPDAKPVGSIMLEGYELLFRGEHGSAVATVEPKTSGSVPCALWLISAKDEAALDRYEGWPHLYRKEMVLVRFGKRRMNVMTYIMNDGYDIAKPGIHYYKTILNGYRDFGLDTSALEAALANTSYASAPFKPCK